MTKDNKDVSGTYMPARKIISRNPLDDLVRLECGHELYCPEFFIAGTIYDIEYLCCKECILDKPIKTKYPKKKIVGKFPKSNNVVLECCHSMDCYELFKNGQIHDMEYMSCRICDAIDAAKEQIANSEKTKQIYKNQHELDFEKIRDLIYEIDDNLDKMRFTLVYFNDKRFQNLHQESRDSLRYLWKYFTKRSGRKY